MILYLARAFLIGFAFITLSTDLLKASFNEEMQQKYQNFARNTDAFTSFDFPMTKTEKESLRTLKIGKFDEENNFGDLDQLTKQMEIFLNNLGTQENDAAQVVAILITRLTESILQASQKETAWVALRAFKETTAYDQSRWHMDGGYYEPFDQTQFKVAITLKGPSTLFYPLSSLARYDFFDFSSKSWKNILTLYDQPLQQKSKTEEQIQTEKNNIYSPLEKNFFDRCVEASQIISLPTGQGMIFKVGDAAFAALHSEPPIKEDRLFISIVPCDFKDIDGMRQRLGKATL